MNTSVSLPDKMDYLKSSNEVQLLNGLRTSIECAVSSIMASNVSVKSYRHDKKKKFEQVRTGNKLNL